MKKIKSKIKLLELQQHVSHCKSMIIIADSQGQLTPQSQNWIKSNIDVQTLKSSYLCSQWRNGAKI